MIKYQADSPLQISVPTEQLEPVMQSLADGGTDFGLEEVPSEIRASFGQVLKSIRSSFRIEMRGESYFIDHEFLAAREGVVRDSAVSADNHELALSPTPVLPGIMAMVAQFRPTEPLSSEVAVTLPRTAIETIFTGDDSERFEALHHIRAVTEQFPPAVNPPELAMFGEVEDRVIRFTRAAQGGDRVVYLLRLRGHYLLVNSGAMGFTARGTDSTQAARAMFELLNPRKQS